MTEVSLEIKRLDYGSSSSGGGSPIKPPVKSPIRASNSQIQPILVKSFDEKALENSPSKEIEIPISIIKSQSFNNNLQTSSTAPAAVISTPAEQSSSTTLDNRINRNLSITSEKKLSINNATDFVPNSSPNKLGTSDLNISGSNEMNSDLRFNKYGFIDKSQSTEAGTADTGTLTNKNKTLKPNEDTGSLNSSKNQANLKDYLQNTDVEQFAEHTPIKVIHERERKWMDMLNHYDVWMKKRFKKVRSRCRKGIPQSMRSKAWMYLTGAILEKERRPTHYADCLENKSGVDVARYIEDIKKDLHRQFPSHELFIKEEGRVMLFNVLRAYAVHNREVGYCQAQGPIAALLLMHMPEEDAFWMLVMISDFYLKEYFQPGLEKVQIDGQALFYLFKKQNESAHKLLVKQGIDPILYMTEWFMCIYARTLPWCTVLRVWDMFFCEGVKVLYKVGLYLMLNAFGTKQKLQRCQQQGMYETLNCLKNLPIECLDEVSLVRGSNLIDLSSDDFAKAFEKSKEEFKKQMKKSREKAKEAPVSSSYKNTNKKTRDSDSKKK